MCGMPATHKVAEEIMFDDPVPYRHGRSQYICCECFQILMGRSAGCLPPRTVTEMRDAKTND